MTKDIFITTRGRLEKQYTWDRFDDRMKERIALVCPKEEAAEHKRRGRDVIVSPIEGLSYKRQWILDNVAPARFYLVDDDLNFHRRKGPDNYQLRWVKQGSPELIEMFDLLDGSLQDYAQVGISHKGKNCFIKPFQWKEGVGPILQLMGFNRNVLKKGGIRFDALELKSDLHVTLSLLERGWANRTLVEFCFHHKGANLPGGVSLYRTAEKSDKAAHDLMALHPGLVRLVRKKSILADGFMKDRLDVVCAWKKAYEQGLRGQEG